jgi:hypothetical protein
LSSDKPQPQLDVFETAPRVLALALNGASRTRS